MTVDNNNFHFERNFHSFEVDNQDIFDVKREIEPHFFLQITIKAFS